MPHFIDHDPIHFHFPSGIRHFGSAFIGEKRLCEKLSKPIQTSLNFFCDPSAKWNTSVVHNHGGAMSPKPVSWTFNKDLCLVITSTLVHLQLFFHITWYMNCWNYSIFATERDKRRKSRKIFVQSLKINLPRIRYTFRTTISFV